MTDAEIMILRIFKAPKEVIERNPNLKMILRWGAGFDSVDIEAAGARGILVTNTPGANANAVSELAVTLMLTVYRKILEHTDSLRSGVWSKNTYLNSSFSLFGKTVGIVGGGNIGRQVALKVQAFGASVQYYDAFRLPAGHELLTTPGIVVTPHVGGGTADIGDVIMPMLAKDICDFADRKSVV